MIIDYRSIFTGCVLLWLLSLRYNVTSWMMKCSFSAPHQWLIDSNFSIRYHFYPDAIVLLFYYETSNGSYTLPWTWNNLSKGSEGAIIPLPVHILFLKWSWPCERTIFKRVTSLSIEIEILNFSNWKASTEKLESRKRSVSRFAHLSIFQLAKRQNLFTLFFFMYFLYFLIFYNIFVNVLWCRILKLVLNIMCD